MRNQLNTFKTASTSPEATRGCSSSQMSESGRKLPTSPRGNLGLFAKCRQYESDAPFFQRTDPAARSLHALPDKEENSSDPALGSARVHRFARTPRRRSPTRKTRGSIPCDPTKACSQERPLRGHAVGRHFSLPEEQSRGFNTRAYEQFPRVTRSPASRAPRRRACLRRGPFSLFAASSRRTATTCLSASQNGFSVTSRAEPTRNLE